MGPEIILLWPAVGLIVMVLQYILDIFNRGLESFNLYCFKKDLVLFSLAGPLVVWWYLEYFLRKKAVK